VLSLQRGILPKKALAIVRRRVLTIPRGLETFQPPCPGADTYPILTSNPAGCCNGAKMFRSEQKNYVIAAKTVFT
jgi:hypothetical protein